MKKPSWLSRLKPFKGDVYAPGKTLPEPSYETATGRKLYTVQQIRVAYEHGANDARLLLVRCRNILSHPSHWAAEAAVKDARTALYNEVIEHLSGLDKSEAWNCRTPTEPPKEQP